jgi:PAS domain-containing protein
MSLIRGFVYPSARHTGATGTMTIIAAEIVSHMNWIAVLLLVTISQQLWIYLAHRRSPNRDELFRIITENAADMIALVNVKGRRLYNSPAYSKILGYSPAELAQTPVFEQIHPDDRFKVLEAAREARVTGIGRSLEYRLRHIAAYSSIGCSAVLRKGSAIQLSATQC